MDSAVGHLVHTEEAAPVKSTGSVVSSGSDELGTRSSAGEHALHTGGVVGSIPTASTTFTLAGKRGRKPKDACSVYVITNGGGQTKIGMSNNPGHRLNGLRTASSTRLDIRDQWTLRTREQASLLEKTLHRLFKPLKIAREWFDVEADAVASLVDLLLADDPRAEALAHAIVEEHVHERLAETAWKRRANLSVRWHGERRAELQDEFDRETELSSAARRLARTLGLKASEFDLWRDKSEARDHPHLQG